MKAQKVEKLTKTKLKVIMFFRELEVGLEFIIFGS